MPSHQDLVVRACRWLRGKGCKPVFAEFQHMCSNEMPDAIGFTATLVHVVEAKISLADFRRDAKKWHHRGGNSMGHRRWYVAPRGLLTPAMVDGHGLLEPSGRGLRVVAKAPPRTPSDMACQEALGILRNAIVRHEKGVAWDRDRFRFAPLERNTHGGS